MSEEDVELVRRGYAGWNEGDMDAMLSTIHPDFEYVTSGLFPGIAPVYRGHEGWRHFWRDFRGGWETLQIEINEIRDLGERVIAFLTFHARHREGLEVHRQFANIWTLRDRLGVRLQAYADWTEALEAAGLSE